MSSSVKRVVVAITGASGSAYGRALLQEMAAHELEIHLIVSSTAEIVMEEEIGLSFTGGRFNLQEYIGPTVPVRAQIVQHDDRDLTAPPASGSFRTEGMVICPCSMKTLAMVAHGTGASLIARAADACLKERRRLVLVPRETPLSLIHLRNMVTVTEAGAVVLPAMPGFYKRPSSIDELIRHLVLKIMDAMGLDHDINLRWKDNA